MSALRYKEKVIAVLNSIQSGDPQPFSYINPHKYIQHNLSMPDGLQGIAGIITSQPVGTFKAKVVRAFQEGDYVFTQTEYDFMGEKVGFDIFRFEDGLIVEHWDNLRDLMPANRSGRTQTDGFTEVVDLHNTADNKAIVENFVKENLLINQKTYANYMKSDLVQHNPEGADGIDSFLAAADYFSKNDIAMYFTKIHRVLAEGNFVLTKCEGLFGPNGGQPTSFYDLFRLENGMIVEHWDVIEPILDKAQWQNTNGKF